MQQDYNFFIITVNLRFIVEVTSLFIRVDVMQEAVWEERAAAAVFYFIFTAPATTEYILQRVNVVQYWVRGAAMRVHTLFCLSEIVLKGGKE